MRDKMLTRWANKAMNIARVESLARSHTENAINVLSSIMMEEECPPAVRVRAAEALLNRGWGRPKEVKVVEDAEGEQVLKIVREFVHVTKPQEEIDNEDLVVDYSELRPVNGNGRANGG